jgi:mannose-6-phosphate isomerase-like protein (cupin superfamily)
MKSSLLVVVAVSALGGLGLLAQAPRGGQPAAGDPKTPVFWSAQRMKEIDTGLSTRVSPQTNMAGERLIASANVIYRAGDSGSEIHEKLADLIFVREGEGSIVVGGKLIGGQTTAPDEIRGDSLEGGTRYPVTAGDTIYIPANMPHQFFVEKGKHWVITIVKITPKP